MNEDQIIADAFMSVRQGILAGDWNLVCDAYEAISGERIEPPTQKPKSRLEAIREKMGVVTEPADEVDAGETTTPIVDVSSMSVGQLKDWLLQKGHKPSDLKNKKKEDLLELLLKPTPFEPDVKDIQETEIKGGKRFGLGTVKIVSDQYDPIEAEANKKLAKKKTSIDYKRSSTPVDNSSDENSDFRFHKNPTLRPPWS